MKYIKQYYTMRAKNFTPYITEIPRLVKATIIREMTEVYILKIIPERTQITVHSNNSISLLVRGVIENIRKLPQLE